MRCLLLVAMALPLLAAAPPGKPVSCISSSMTGESRIVGDSAILFRVGNQWYRSDLQPRCTGLDPSRGIKQTIRGGSICAGDPFEVFAPGQGQGIGMTVGNCNYGAFTPIDKPAS